MTTAAVIVAAGRGTRAGSATPKQWCKIAGATVADHSLRAFQEHGLISRVVIVLHPDDLHRADGFRSRGIEVARGGADRAESVRNGLAALSGHTVDRVLIHDVARACVTAVLISSVVAALDHDAGAAPALAVTDALWTGDGSHVTDTKDRTGLYRAQTPQGFHFAAIRDAHAKHPGGAADDVEVARAAGMTVAIVAGDEDNLKITLPADFDRAERILRARNGH
jgi:2-C-methyl-D-erythritol 4-phosphate cytidylyltransferase